MFIFFPGKNGVKRLQDDPSGKNTLVYAGDM